MRIQRLELIKFGKFTNCTIDLPHAVHDFHVIVGPNEAGKSTLRLAVQELLFGIPTRSPMDFKHLLSELRLGATLTEGDQSLSFQRAKAAKNSLRTPANDPLSDHALQPYLGTTDRKFFDQMFALDHTRLVDGGKQILDANNDLGQLLFQSAAGVASMGRIRVQLEQEADELWGTRLKRTRDYSVGLEKFEKATAELRSASIKAKAWSEASAKVSQTAEAFENAKERHAQLESARGRFERARRTAVFVHQLREAETALKNYRAVAELPFDSADQVTKAKQAISSALVIFELRRTATVHLLESQQSIELDEAVLAMEAAIDDLDQKRRQYAAYPTDLVRREAEVTVQWNAVVQECRSLQWIFDSEDELRKRLPSASARIALNETALTHSGLVQAVDAAKDVLEREEADLTDLQIEFDAITASLIPPPLKTAEAQSRALGDVVTAAQEHATMLKKAQTALDEALNRLGSWRMTPQALDAMVLPGEGVVSGMLQIRQQIEVQMRAAHERARVDTEHSAKLLLDIDQFQQSHQGVSLEEVEHRRSLRDGIWRKIKSEGISIQTASSPFEAAMTDADEIADRRLDNVEMAAQLQSLRQESERAVQAEGKSLADCTRLTDEHAADASKWTQLCEATGLANLPLESAGEWFRLRDKALEAQRTLQDAVSAADAQQAKVEASRAALLKAMTDAGGAVSEHTNLVELRAVAKDWMDAMQHALNRKDGLSPQIKTAGSAVKDARQQLKKASDAFNAWGQSWKAALARFGLPEHSDIAAAARAVESIKAIDDGLARISAIRKERIATMNADLDAFKVDAILLAQHLLPDMVDQSPTAIALNLHGRLTKARTDKAELQRSQGEVTEARKQEQAALEEIEKAKALLAPLFLLAGVPQTAESADGLLADCIARSDQKRAFAAQQSMALTGLEANSDGLSRQEVEAEIAHTDLTEAGVELARLQSELQAIVTLLPTLSADHVMAQHNLAEMVGSDNAATAEARRQEALAQMTDAAERYVRVATAASLLRWSVDQYREQKQGPLLARASAIFSGLTLGAFRRLHVDFEAEKMSLAGQRANGELVEVTGLSDGTRDQLYFALRLAALEMHLEQAMRLPFLADDLFINYDDERSRAGLAALKDLSTRTQVIFLTHHTHLRDAIQSVFGEAVNVVQMDRETVATV